MSNAYQGRSTDANLTVYAKQYLPPQPITKP